jgi:hypothetical protein
MSEPKLEMSDAEVVRDYAPAWMRRCESCRSKPVVPVSGLCGPCHFGTAEALNGGWWDYKANDFNETFAENHLPEAR